MGCSLDEIWVGERKHEGLEKLLLARGIRGAILAPQPLGSEEIQLDSRTFYTVTLGMSVKNPDIIRVCRDHYHTVASLVKRLAEEGFRKPVFYARKEIDDRVDNMMSHGFSHGVKI